MSFAGIANAKQAEERKAQPVSENAVEVLRDGILRPKPDPFPEPEKTTAQGLDQMLQMSAYRTQLTWRRQQHYLELAVYVLLGLLLAFSAYQVLPRGGTHAPRPNARHRPRRRRSRERLARRP